MLLKTNTTPRFKEIRTCAPPPSFFWYSNRLFFSVVGNAHLKKKEVKLRWWIAWVCKPCLAQNFAQVWSKVTREQSIVVYYEHTIQWFVFYGHCEKIFHGFKIPFVTTLHLRPVCNLIIKPSLPSFQEERWLGSRFTLCDRVRIYCYCRIVCLILNCMVSVSK